MNFKKHLKKFFIYFLVIVLLSIALATVYTFIPKTLDSFDNRLRDYMFILRGSKPDSKNVVIVDIDDKSLKKVGQWPWSRNIVSNLLTNLNNAGVGLIAFDIVFAEADRSNPATLVKKLHIKTTKDVPNYDYEFAKTVAQTPTILGYQFQLTKDKFMETRAPDIPAIFIERGRTQQNKDMVITAYGTILLLHQ